MTWFKVDDGFWAHPKTFMLSADAIALWLKAGTWSCQHLTDGVIPMSAVPVFGGSAASAGELVSVGLWDQTDSGYAFHDWDEYQPSAAVEKAKRAARAESARKAACVRWHGEECGGQCESHASGHASTDAPGDAETMRAAMPRPVPSREDSKESSTRAKNEIPLPSDWVPTKSHYDIAKERNVDIEAEAEAFRDHAYTHDRRAARWNGAFTTWLKKSRPRPQAPSTNPDAWMNRSQQPKARWQGG